MGRKHTHTHTYRKVMKKNRGYITRYKIQRTSNLQHDLLGVLASLTWFVNSGSGGDLREAQESRDVAISADEVESLKGSVRKRSEQRREVPRVRLFAGSLMV